ncbi:MAG: hypothetical protein M0T80_14730 [Actinomycetota bacterium]|nr:hypothetical protein [Actinomycetota bacterium]
MISWATNGEDVVLARALPSGFGTFVDVGAGDPDEGTATRLLSERGWYGISVVTSPAAAARHRERRPGGVALELPAGASPERPLDAVLEELSKGRPDLLRIGSAVPAGPVLAGLDLARWAPRVVLVEAVDPHTGAGQEMGAWSETLAGAGYVEALFDGVNHFFAPAGAPELLERLRVPRSSLDGFLPWTEARWADEVARLEQTVSQLDETISQMRERTRLLERTLDERSGVAPGASGLVSRRSLHVPPPPAGLSPRRAVTAPPAPAPAPSARVALVGDPGSWAPWLGPALAATLGAQLCRAAHPGDVAWTSLPASVVLELPWPRTRMLRATLAAAGMVAVCTAGTVDNGGWSAGWRSTPATVLVGPDDLLGAPAGALAGVVAACGLTPTADPGEVLADLGVQPGSAGPEGEDNRAGPEGA